MVELADVIARHAVATVVLLIVFGSVVTGAIWHFAATKWERVWKAGVRVWEAVRTMRWVRTLERFKLVRTLTDHSLTVVRYLGLYAIGALVLAIAALVAFVEIVDEIGLDEDLAQFDVALAAAVERHVTTEVLRASALVTRLGDPEVLAGIASVVFLILLVRKKWVLVGSWVVATAGGALLNRVMKAQFARVRPIHDHGFAHETSWSFPSGHASASLLFYSLLGYLLVRHTPRPWHLPILVATVTLVVSVGASRVLLQVHYFSDVLAGYTTAAAWAASCVAGLEAARWRERTRGGRRLEGLDEAR